MDLPYSDDVSWKEKKTGKGRGRGKKRERVEEEDREGREKGKGRGRGKTWINQPLLVYRRSLFNETPLCIDFFPPA